MMEGNVPVGLVIIGFVFLVIFAKMTLRIIRPFEKGLVERLGKFNRVEEPGLVVLIPMMETMRKVDMREQVIDVPPQDVITKDNVGVNVDAVIYFQVTDAFKVIYNVANFAMASLKLAQTNLRNVIGGLALDETLTSRERISAQLQRVLDEATDKWGVKVNRVEIQKIDPPADITQAMSRQMKAERDKRATILEAEGVRQSQILQAEGERQKRVLEAEGKAQAIKTVADAEKYQIEVVYHAIHAGNPTKDLIAIKYMETLAQMADGQATKIFLPIESTGLLGSLAGIREIFSEKTGDRKAT